MTFTVNLDEPIEQLLKENNLPVGGKRRKGGAGAPVETDESAAQEAAKVTIIGFLKKAREIGYDVAVKGAQASAYVGAAGLVLYVADESFKQNLCNPMTLSLSRTISMIPSAAGYAATCDAAAAAYNAAISTAALAVSPLVVMALKKVASIVVSDDVIESVAGAILMSVKNPQAAATAALEVRTKARRGSVSPAAAAAEESVPEFESPKPRKGKKGGKKTKKRATKKRKVTRRHAFSY